MKAAVYESFGGPEVVHLSDVEKPAPKAGEVLIRIHATTVTSGDWRVRSLNLPPGFGPFGRLMLGITKPRKPVLGTECAGEIAEIGSGVTKFKVGDRVFAFAGVAMGCHAEYRCMPENGMVTAIPPGLTYAEAASLPFGGTTMLDFYRRGKLRNGERVLVNGASGAVGTAAVQLARHFGAEVTGVCGPTNIELVRSLGAAHVIDYTKEDFTKNGETYDVIVDTAGTAPYSRCASSLKDGGRLLLVLSGLGGLLSAPWISMTSNKRVVAGPASERPEDLQRLAELAGAGELKAIIGRRFPFEQIVEAHRYVDSGHKRGSAVVEVLGA